MTTEAVVDDLARALERAGVTYPQMMATWIVRKLIPEHAAEVAPVPPVTVDAGWRLVTDPADDGKDRRRLIEYDEDGYPESMWIRDETVAPVPPQPSTFPLNEVAELRRATAFLALELPGPVYDDYSARLDATLDRLAALWEGRA